jgi:ketosteroid isomerase-like protein
MLQLMSEREAAIRALYTAFNARDAEAVLAAMAPDVAWPNGWEGGQVIGRDAVRDYWARQWAEIDPRVEPVAFADEDGGAGAAGERVAVTVFQTVRSRDGALLSEDTLTHTYSFDAATGLITAMEIGEPAPPA